MERSGGFAWRNFIFILLVGISFAVSLMAVPMYMGEFIGVYGPGDAAWLMSWTSVAGTVIAFFTASIQAKFSPKAMVLMCAVTQVVGDVLMLVGGGITVMFVGRFILGLGNGLIATAAPSLVSCLWKDPQKRGIPTSVWTMWIALGSIVISFLTVPLGSWHTAFIFALVLAVVALIGGIFGITVSKEEQLAVVAGNADVKVLDAFKSPWVILCFLMVLCFAFGFSCYTAFAPSYFIENMGPEAGSSLNGMGNFIGIVAGLVVGVVFRATKKHPLILVVVFVLAVVAALGAFAFTDAMMIICTAVLFFFVFNCMVPSVFNNVQWASPDPSVIGAAFGLLAIASNAGGIPASPVMAAFIADGATYFEAMMPAVVVTVVGLVCAIVFFVGRSKYVAKAFEERAAQDAAEASDAR